MFIRGEITGKAAPPAVIYTLYLLEKSAHQYTVQDRCVVGQPLMGQSRKHRAQAPYKQPTSTLQFNLQVALFYQGRMGVLHLETVSSLFKP